MLDLLQDLESREAWKLHVEEHQVRPHAVDERDRTAAMVLRRLSTRWIVGLALGWLLAGEAVVGLTMYLGGGPTLLGAVFFTPGRFADGRLLIVYPFVPWLAIMMLGWAFGRYLLRTRERQGSLRAAERLLLAGGFGGLGIFAVVRGLNGYGNMRLFRDSGSLQQWLHVSKYPPSLAFSALWLGVMALCLWGFFQLQQRPGRPSPANPLLVFGQTALFFYLAHAYLLILPARLMGVEERLGLTATYAATVAVLILLYPCCLWYRGYKARHPSGWPQYV